MSHQPIISPRPVHAHLDTMSGRGLTFLNDIEEGRIPVNAQCPVAERDVLAVAAIYLDEGWISARRMARAMDTDFETLNKSFSHYGIHYQIGL
jgi:hypothetical protein